MEKFSIRRKYVGALEDGTRVYVNATVQDLGHGMLTVDHETAKDGQRLSLTGETVYSAGQIIDDVRAIVKPCEGLTAADIEELVSIWEEYHLNDMNALCSHQTVKWETSRGYKSMDLEGIGACPVSGYRPGSAWLFKPVPESVLERVRQILA